MKNLITITILVLLSIIQQINCLKNTDLCLVQHQKKECKKSTNNTKDCKFQSCTGKYTFQCTPEHCSLNKTICNDFFQLHFGLKTLESLKSHISIKPVYQQRLSDYLSLTSSLIKCPNKKFDQKHDIACLNGFNCKFIKELPLRYAGITIESSIDCPCQGLYFTKIKFFKSFNYFI
jgi:hypothetical protein